MTRDVTAQVCEAASCLALGSDRVRQDLARRAPAGVAVTRVGCLGLCAAGPLVRVTPTGALVERVRPEDLDPVEAVLREPSDAPAPRAFFTRQKKIVPENCGTIDPERIEDYLAAGGYEALHAVVTEMTPGEVIDRCAAAACAAAAARATRPA